MKEARAPSTAMPGENLLPILFLGLCPAIAVTTRVLDAVWMAAGVIIVLVLSRAAMSLLSVQGGGRPTARWLRALLITALLTASLEAVLLAFAPAVSAALGIYAPLIAVNCLVLDLGAAAPLGKSLRAALGEGARFAAALVLIALVREALGAGTITLVRVGGFPGTIGIPSIIEQPVRALGAAGGGLLCLGYLAAAIRAIALRSSAKSSSTGANV